MSPQIARQRKLMSPQAALDMIWDELTAEE